MTQRCSLPMLSFWASSTVDPNRCFSVVSFSNTVTRGSHQLPVINRNRLGIRTGWSGGCSSAQATMDEQPAPREDHPQSNGSRSSGPPDVQRSKPRWPGYAVIVMGVAGSGKSTVGKLLSQSMPCAFIDADDFHSEENKEKMRHGIPLTEDDRLPWLEDLRDELEKYTSKGEWVVMACSALQPQYRTILLTADQSHRIQDMAIRDFSEGSHQVHDMAMRDYSNGSLKTDANSSEWHKGRVVFAYLKGSVELFASRLGARFKEGKHFMPPSLLQSQMDLLETEESDPDIVSVDASWTPAEIVDSLISTLSLRL